MRGWFIWESRLYPVKWLKRKLLITKEKTLLKEQLKSPDCVYRITTDILQLDMASEECFYITMLNTKNGINGIAEVSHDNLNTYTVLPREVFKPNWQYHV